MSFATKLVTGSQTQPLPYQVRFHSTVRRVGVLGTPDMNETGPTLWSPPANHNGLHHGCCVRWLGRRTQSKNALDVSLVPSGSDSGGAGLSFTSFRSLFSSINVRLRTLKLCSVKICGVTWLYSAASFLSFS